MLNHRVVSLLPSATELLCLIPSGSTLLVGRSHEDNYPLHITHLPVLTSQHTKFTTAKEVNTQVSNAMKLGLTLYSLDAELLRSLEPTIILTQDLCSVCSIDMGAVMKVVEGMESKPRVVSLSPVCLEGILDDVLVVGEAVGLLEEAKVIKRTLEDRVNAVTARAALRLRSNPSSKRPRVAFIEWSDPLYIGGHWTPQLIHLAGGDHSINPPRRSEKGGAGKSYAIHHSELVSYDPEIIIFSPCGMNLDQTRSEAVTIQKEEWWRELKAVRNGHVVIVDGDCMFNRPGPRVVEALEFLGGLVGWYCERREGGERGESKGNVEGFPVGFPFEWLSPPSSDGGISQEVVYANEGEGNTNTNMNTNMDIENAHRAACANGVYTYADPRTGYTVFTQLFAEERGTCCGSGCRHCPFEHVNVRNKEKKKHLTKPMVIERTVL